MAEDGVRRRGAVPLPVGRRTGASLFIRTLFSFLAVLAVLLALLAGAAIAGVGWSSRQWTSARSDETRELLGSLVLASYRSRGTLDREAIAAATLPYLDESTYLLVYSPDGALVFAWRLGERMDQPDAADPGAGRNFLRRHAGDAVPVDLLDGDRVVGKIAAGVLSFIQDAANSGFLRTLTLVAGAGAAVSFLLAVSVALVFSSRLSSHAARLSAGLARLAAGERSVSFPAGGAREMALIGDSAGALQSQLIQEERLRTQWAADVSHDLRTPLAALRSQLEAMGDGVLPITPERLARTLEDLSRVEALVADLAELSRIESPGMKPVIAPADARALLDDVGELFAHEARRRGIAFSCVAEPGLSLAADRHLMLRAVTNLVQNAFQHVTAGGAVAVRIQAEDTQVAIRVENSGVIPPEEIPLVFDRLYRGEKSRHSPGSGLGLTIARAVALLHDGTIAISQEDPGTVVAEILIPESRRRAGA